MKINWKSAKDHLRPINFVLSRTGKFRLLYDDKKVTEFQFPGNNKHNRDCEDLIEDLVTYYVMGNADGHIKEKVVIYTFNPVYIEKMMQMIRENNVPSSSAAIFFAHEVKDTDIEIFEFDEHGDLKGFPIGWFY